MRLVQSYLEDPRDCRNLRRGTLPEFFFTDAGEPTSYEEASAAADSATWHLEMESEMHSIHANKTWDLVYRRALPCKWVYRLKETSDSTTPKYKASLVAKGFRQEYVNFDEIFSPVVKMTTLHFMLGVVAIDNLELIQLDVKMAILHGDLRRKFIWSSRMALWQPVRNI